MPTSFDNEVNILIGGVAPNHALRSALGTDHLIFEYEFFFFSNTICKNFFTKISLWKNLSAQTDVTTRPDPLILLTVFDDWRSYRLSCIAHGTWAYYHFIDNELIQFPVWPNHALPSALGTDHLIVVEGLGQFLLSMNFFFSASLFARIFFHQNKSLQEFFLLFNVILLHQEKKPLWAEWSKSILKEIIMFQKYV